MKYTQQEISSAVEQFVQRTPRIERDAILGLPNSDDRFQQVHQLSIHTLLRDPNALFQVLQPGAEDLATQLDAYEEHLDQMDLLVDGLTSEVREDPITDAQLNRLDSAILNASLSANPTTDTVDGALSAISRSLSDSLRTSSGASPTPKESKLQLKTHLLDIAEVHNEIVASTDSLRQSYNSFLYAQLSTNASSKTLQAVDSLAYDLRVERVLTDSSQSDSVRRQRLLEVEAARATLQSISTTPDHLGYRFLSGKVPTGRDIRFSVVADEPTTLEYVGTKSGAFPIVPGDSVILSTDGNAPTTVTFQRTQLPTLFSTAAPVMPNGGEALYFVAEHEMYYGPWDITLDSPGVQPFNRLFLGTAATPLTGNGAMVGMFAHLKYTGTPGIPTTIQECVSVVEGQLYKVVRLFLSGARTYLELDPPLPYENWALLPMPTLGWTISFLPITARWEVAAFANLTELTTRISGPSNVASQDVLQPWRVHTLLTSVIPIVGGPFQPGERIYNAAGTKESIVVHQESTTKLWIQESVDPFIMGEVVTGRTSAAAMTVNASAGQLADVPGNSGAPNSARLINATALGTRLKITAREVLGSGTQASTAGAVVTLTLAAGERGFFELGACPLTVMVINSVPYTIQALTSNTVATLTSAPPATVNKAWSILVPARITKLGVVESGLKMKHALTDVNGLRGYPAPVPPTYRFRSYPVPEFEAKIAATLNLQAPQIDDDSTLSAYEVRDAIETAQVTGLKVSVYKETLYTTPESGGPSVALVVSSTAALVTGTVPSSLAGCFFVPLRGAHMGRQFAIQTDTAGPPHVWTLYDAPTASETVTQFRIDSYRIRVYEESADEDSKIVFGSASGHAKLGFPVGSSVYASFRTGELKEGQQVIDPVELGIVKGDVLVSVEGAHDPLVIQSVDAQQLRVDSLVTAEIQDELAYVRGTCPEQWSTLETQLNLQIGSWQPIEEGGMDRLSKILGRVSDSNLPVQPAEKIELRAAIQEMKTQVTALKTALRNYQPTDGEAARSMIDMLQESGYDRGASLLSKGKFEEYFTGTQDTMISTSYLQTQLSGVRETLGVKVDPLGTEVMDEEAGHLDVDITDEERSGVLEQREDGEIG